MTGILIDSSVPVDVISESGDGFDWSSQALEQAIDRHRVVINPVVFAEVSVGFRHIEDLDSVLPRNTINREALPYEAAFLAGKAFVPYRRRGGPRLSVLPDFLIGAHASVAGYRLLTRDVARYRTHFPRLDLIAPDKPGSAGR